MSYPGATIKDYTGITLGKLIAFLTEVAEQEGDDCKLGSPGSGGDDNLYRVKIGGRRGGKCFTLWMDEGYDENDQFDRDDGLLVKKKKKPATKAKKPTPEIAADVPNLKEQAMPSLIEKVPETIGAGQATVPEKRAPRTRLEKKKAAEKASAEKDAAGADDQCNCQECILLEIRHIEWIEASNAARRE